MSAQCDAARGWIAEALDGELAADEATALAHHLGTCRQCSAIFRAEVASHRLLMERAARRTEVPTKATRRIAMPRRTRPRRSETDIRRFAAAAVLAIGAVIGVLAWPRHAPAPTPAPEQGVPAIATVIAAASGSVVVRDGHELPLHAELQLIDGDRLRALGSVSVAIAGESTTVAASACDLTLWQNGRHKRWELRSGAITAEVEHQPAGGGLTILTSQASAEVIGTRFTLSAEPMRSRLDVSDGRVRFARLGAAETIEVEAGHSATIEDRPAAPTTPAPPTVKTRVIDDLEGPLRWTLAADAAPMQVALAVAGDGHALRLDYRPRPSDTETFAQVAHPFAFASGDRAIRMRIRVDSAAAKSSWNLQVRQRDRSCWWMGTGFFADLHAGWNDIEVPIPADPKRCTDDQAPYDPTAVTELMLSVCNDSAAFDLDDVSVIAPP